MIRHPRRHWLLAALLAALAGMVDAIGFIKLGGLFVSFMSGNSTRLAVGVVAEPHVGMLAGGLIAAFVAGVVCGALVSARAGRHSRVVVLGFVALLLAGAALVQAAPFGLAAVFLLAMAMGAENAVFQREGEVSIGVTYMTGALVKLGQHIATSLTGGPHWRWVPYLLLWVGLVMGAIVGAALYLRIGGAALWIAALAAAALAVVAAKLGD